MIVTQLNGGLGNQLFQYAIAKKLALKFNTEVVLDTSIFEKHKFRKYSLAQFNFKQRIVTDNERNLFALEQNQKSSNAYYKIIRRILQPVVIREKQFNFDSDVFKNAKKNTYLEGYWQTEKYFSDIRQVLLSDFSIQKPLEKKNMEFANHIRSVNSVSLHIRRGDYVSDVKTQNYHGLCGLDYYDKATEMISQKTVNPVLFVFSDDIAWVKEKFKSSLEIFFVDCNNDDTGYEDLRLMSLCRHNIIANSSFSWWGAWLNRNESKSVIAPQRWFANSAINYSDVIPLNWITL